MCYEVRAKICGFGIAIEIANFLLGDYSKVLHTVLAYALNNINM
jgi:hypothetical protein